VHRCGARSREQQACSVARRQRTLSVSRLSSSLSPRRSAASLARRSAAENIKVLVRVRPANEREMEAGSGVYRKSVEVSGNALTYEGAKPFTFDGCCDEDSTQEQIFEQVGKPMTDSCIDGYNGARRQHCWHRAVFVAAFVAVVVCVCVLGTDCPARPCTAAATIFAYGQTGSGKTWTMEGARRGGPAALPTARAAAATAAAAVAAPAAAAAAAARTLRYSLLCALAIRRRDRRSIGCRPDPTCL
jgi:hypothetical protein